MLPLGVAREHLDFWQVSGWSIMPLAVAFSHALPTSAPAQASGGAKSARAGTANSPPARARATTNIE
jgi:hypothetical protein